MIARLFIIECREMLKSLTYFIVVFCIAGFFIMQMDAVYIVEKPVKGEATYGKTYSKDETIIMQSSLEKLVSELRDNRFVTYPYGYYKVVVPSEEVSNKIYEYIKEISTIPLSDNERLRVKPDRTYEDVSEIFNEIDQLLGGGTTYEKSRLYLNTAVDVTYEQALKNYNDFIYKDRISGAFARVFCDYMGIILGIMPVFLAVTRMLRDKRAKAMEVIYSKKGSAFSIVFSRYLAIVVMLLIPVILLSINSLLQTLYIAEKGQVIDYLAYFKGIFGWLLPTVMFVSAVGFFFTEVSNGPIAVLIQGIFWYVSVFASNWNLTGYVGMNLIPRFNTIGDYDMFQAVFNELLVNRVFYTGMSLLLILMTVLVFELKRKGKWPQYGTLFKHGKSIR